MSMIEARALRTWFPIRTGVFGRVQGHVRALDEVDIDLQEQEIVAVVGESGCGKTTLGMSLLGLTPPTSGSIRLGGVLIDTQKSCSWKSFRKDYQIIFQDPYSSLNPRHTIHRILGEGLLLHGICTPRLARERTADLLQLVGLSPDYLNRFPHEFSGGQRQRVAIARAIGMQPKVIVCDEVVAALDVSVQAQIVQLLLDLKQRMKLALLFITHDLSLVKAISDRVYVMYLGKVVEAAPSRALFSQPRHPYTAALLASIPTLDRKKRPKTLAGDVPSPVNIPRGCVFQGRCPRVQDVCRTVHPDLCQVGESRVACCFPLG